MAGPSLADKVVKLDRALRRARIEHAFGGALALAYYAVPRTTVDVDVNVFVPPSELGSVEAALRRAGVKEFPAETVVTRDGQMRAWWDQTPIDVFFSYDAVHEAMRASVRAVPFGKASIPILSPEHLVVAKAAFNRPKDWLDIEEVLVAQDDLDVSEIERWLVHLTGGSDPRVARFRALAAEFRNR